jgi:GGDEF domain-containing protein
MGLLEKALAYKNKINRNGQKTIMDRIAGPADLASDESADNASDPGLNPDFSGDKDILYLNKEDLVEVEDGVTPKVAAERNSSEYGGPMDYPAFFELSRDILSADSGPELFDVILFSIMGQIGVSSSSIMMPGGNEGAPWEIVESRGVHVNKEEISFNPSDGILEQLIRRKEIIDIEEYRDNTLFIDDYYVYIAIDARMLVPLEYKSEVLGVIILGNKLTEEDFTAEDRNYLAAIAEFSAFSLRAIARKGMGGPISGGNGSSIIDAIQRKIISDPRGEQTEEIVQGKFREQGILSFAIFILDGAGRDYVLFTCEEEDQLQLKKMRVRIPSDAALINEIMKIEGRRSYIELRQTRAAAAVFSDAQLKRMAMLTVYPHLIEGELIGFTMVFDIEKSIEEFLGGGAARVCGYIFPYLYLMHDSANRRGKYTDSIERTIKRIDAEIAHAQDLGIPVTLIAITIKNYKRYHAIYGNLKVKEMLRHIEDFIFARLSERDFSVRYDRNKFMIVLTGKDKKYAVPLANAVCNELVNNFSTQEAQLLVTFLTAEYPLDGKDTSGLIDAVN